MQPICLKLDTSTVEQLSDHPGQADHIEGTAISRNETHPAEWSDNARRKLADQLEGRSLFAGDELSAQNVCGKVVSTEVSGSSVTYSAELASSLTEAVNTGEADLFMRGRVTTERERDGTERRVTDAAVGRLVVGHSRQAALSIHEPASVASLSDSPEDKQSFGVAALADVDDLSHDEEYLLKKQNELSSKY